MSRRKSGGGGSFLVALVLVIAVIHFGHINPSKLFNSLGSGVGSNASYSVGGYSCGQIEHIWIANGGPPGAAVQMASIAIAESGGNPNAENDKNSNGSIDYGLFQINSNTATPTFNTDANTREAIDVYNQDGYTAWVTYNNGVANAC